MRKLLLLGLVAGVCAVALSLRSSEKSRIRDEWTAMGTIAGLTFRGDAPDREAVRGLVQARYERLESLLSAWDADSELSRLSREGGTNWIGCVSAEVTECYHAAMLLAERSGGAFNPQIGARMRELGFSSGRSFADFDLGAIAKGFAVDAAWQDVTRRFGESDLLIDLGGNLRVVGGKWRTGVRNPFDQGYAATIVLTNGEAVATSGNYERFVVQNGVRRSHIIDGRTGEPVTGMAGVTVVAPTATLADGLSTTLFVLGPEAGERFLAKWHRDVLALWIPDTPESPTVCATRAMAARLMDVEYPLRLVADGKVGK